ncbi:unnamed protein product [Arctia plantaginis]|uniref:Uncharacterized protein n=1 Tax=Arctia plantaginis TaxID=874455 RepID=A0A8S0ZM36_ARCPL|nr:unnamed protein product [Arctia plantaginis]
MNGWGNSQLLPIDSEGSARQAPPIGRRGAASGANTGAGRSGSFDLPPSPRRASVGPDNERTQTHNAPRALPSRLSARTGFVTTPE